MFPCVIQSFALCCGRGSTSIGSTTTTVPGVLKLNYLFFFFFRGFRGAIVLLTAELVREPVRLFECAETTLERFLVFSPLCMPFKPMYETYDGDWLPVRPWLPERAWLPVCIWLPMHPELTDILRFFNWLAFYSMSLTRSSVQFESLTSFIWSTFCSKSLDPSSGPTDILWFLSCLACYSMALNWSLVAILFVLLVLPTKAALWRS